MPPSEYAHDERRRKKNSSSFIITNKCMRTIGDQESNSGREGKGIGRKTKQGDARKGDEHSILSSLEKVEPDKESTEQ
jgi:hypothetical protein